MAKIKTRPSLGAEPSTSASASRPTKPKSKSKKGTTSEAGKLYSSFLPLPLSLPSPVPITSARKAKTSTSSSSVTHYLFVRPHAPRAGSSEDERAAADRTVFVANVPVDGTARSLRAAFGRFGVVEDVVLASGGGGGDELEKAVRGIAVESDSEDEDDEGEDEGEEETEGIAGDEPKFLGTGGPLLPRSKRPRRKPNTLPPSVPDVSPLPPLDVRTPYGPSGARTARVVFVDAVSVARTMAYAGPPIPLNPDTDEPTGLALYESQYTALRPPLAAVRTHADTAMARHDHLHSLLLASRAKQHGAGALVDEDGFTVVVRGGRYGRTAGRKGDPGGAGVGVAKRGFAGDDSDKRKKGRGGAGELADFYKFQMVDRKRKELAQLRARFEDDKKKVDELKKSRRFKPY